MIAFGARANHVPVKSVTVCKEKELGEGGIRMCRHHSGLPVFPLDGQIGGSVSCLRGRATANTSGG